ncbi:MAG: DUF1007 family protein [Campylobacterota bacterium]|nr:DUF1007 family protein [Campylobacterota bacterium]
MKQLFFLLFGTFLSAHPHCFIDVHPTLNKDSLTIRWVLDEMSSQMMIMDYDSDGNGKFSEAESKLLFEDTFKSLIKYEYYTYFYSGSKQIATPEVTSFLATIENYQLNYYFTLPLPDMVSSIEFFDDELFTAYILEKDFITVSDTDKKVSLKKLDGDRTFGYKLELK